MEASNQEDIERAIIEQELLKVASVQDRQEQQRMVEELVPLFQTNETITLLIDLLSDENEAVRSVALLALEKIGYPRNALALPTLLQWVAYIYPDHAPEEESKALTILLNMGPAVLSELALTIKDNNEMENLVSDALANVGELFWERVTQGDEQLQETIIQELARHPDEVLDFLLYVLHRSFKQWWDTAVPVIAAIGYPRNAAAIPDLMWVAINSAPGSREAQDYLETFDAQAIVPYYLDALFALENDDQYPGWKEVCKLLFHVDRTYLAPCGPAIIYQMSSHTTLTLWEMEYLVRLLKEIGPECAEYALPLLLELIRREPGTPVGVAAWRLVNSFDQQTLAPYRLVLASLKLPVQEK